VVFNSETVRVAFERRLSQPVSELSLHDLYAALFSFYREDRPKGAISEDEDGDMLLFQWGSYDWHDSAGLLFECALVRQIIWPDQDGEARIFQLSVRQRRPVTADLKTSDSGEIWCRRLSGLGLFQDAVVSSAPYRICDAAGGSAVLTFEEQ
jgi:hypothetical protein